MKQALEALEFANVNHWWGSSNIEKAITALRLAIEQAERQEPVAWWREDGSICVDESQASAHDIPLYTDRRLIPRDYTAPPQRQPLTPDAVFRIADQHPVEGFDPDIMAFARAIEAKLRHKNTVRMRRATRDEKIVNPGVYWVEDKE